MDYPEDLKYTKTHEWIRVDGNRCRVGITAFAAHELSDVVFVDLPEEGKEVKAGEEICVVESVKAASSIYAPLAGKVVEVNTALTDNPSLLNQSCYTDGWIYELELNAGSDTNHLLTAQSYQNEIKEEA